MSLSDLTKQILVLTPIYPADDIPKGWTPVVHYFAREWVKQGFEVHVVNYVANFPKPLYWISSLFNSWLSSKAGYTIRTTTLKDKEYEIDGVQVYRIMLSKVRPHVRYSITQIDKAVIKTLDYCTRKNISPIVVLSHWANPQLEMMYHLKSHFNVPMCYVCHGDGHFEVYGDDAEKYWSIVDVVGFRSDYIKRRFEIDKKWIKPSFMCYSGIPATYNDNTINRDFETINRVAYVGTLIKRKYPSEIIPALYQTFGSEFTIVYAGEGEERKAIEVISKNLDVTQNVHLLGRIPRDKVIELLDNSDLFIMISRSEVYGLVYLEAMARGCITIASRHEGFDGIIRNGENGFLCEAGNMDELAQILTKVSAMSSEQLLKISNAAMATARELTDENAARKYLSAVIGHINPIGFEL